MVMGTVGKDSVYLLSGEENFLKDEFIKGVKNRLLDKSHIKLNFTSFSAKDSGIEDILIVSKTLPLLGKKRVVVIRNVDKLSERGKASLLSFVKKPAETTCLILESRKPYTANEFLKSLSRHAILIKAQPLKYGALDRWIKQRASTFKKVITNDAVGLLKELAGDNLELLSREIEKIISFIEKKNQITAEDVEEVVGRSIKEDVFILVDYISAKDASKALLLCKRLLEQGKKAHEIIGLIGWYFRKILLAKVVPAQRGRKESFKLPNNFRANELRGKLKLLFDADRALKTGSSKPEFILDVLINRLCVT